MKPREWLMVATVIFGGLGTLGIGAALISPMLFDAPGSEGQSATLVLFACIFSFPAVCLIALIVAWCVFKSGAERLGMLIGYTPMLNIVVGFGTIVYMNLYNGGRLAP
jgi:hypothetical protein